MKVVSEAYKSNRIYKYIFYVFVFTIIGSLIYGLIRPWDIDTKSISFWLSCLFILFVLLFFFTSYFSEETIKEIRVNSNKIEVDYLKNKSLDLDYSDITKISTVRVRHLGKSGYISDGYFVTTIHLKSGKEINISQAEFENYRKIGSR